MGNYVSRRTSDSSAAAGKVVLSDGTVRPLDCPTTVAELMVDHPGEFVAELQSLVGKSSNNKYKKLCPLPADHVLDPEKVYLMFPMTRGKTPKLSAEEAREILKRSAVTRSASFRGVRDGIKEIVGDDDDGWVEKKGKKKKKKEGEEALVMEVLDERPEFLSQQRSSRGWKPSLDTIEERRREKSVPHWLF